MADITSPIALDESFNTTETTPRNIADVVADETGDLVTQATAIVTKLQALINAVKPNASDIPLAPITGMVADDVQEGISELKGTLTHEAVTLTNTDSRLYYNQIYKENNKVTLYIEVYVTTTPPTSNPIVLGVLPSGSRPTHRHIAFNNVTNANSTALLGGCQFIVNTNGEITLFYFGNYTQSFATLEVSFYVN